MDSKEAMKNQVDAQSKQLAKIAAQLPPSEIYAITTVLGNVHNGAFWGFVPMSEAKSHVKDIVDSNKNIIARRLGDNNCLIEVEPAYLANTVKKVCSGLMSTAEVNEMAKARNTATMAFSKFLISKGKAIARTGKQFMGVIGIYSTNDVDTILYKSQNIPAYRVNLETCLMAFKKYGYAVLLSDNKYHTAEEIMSNPKMIDSFFQTAIVSAKKTGLFITIKSLYTADDYKRLELELKQSFGKGSK